MESGLTTHQLSEELDQQRGARQFGARTTSPLGSILIHGLYHYPCTRPLAVGYVTQSALLFVRNLSSSLSFMRIVSLIYDEIYSWSESFVSCIPGLIGRKIRVVFYNVFLRRSALKSVGPGSTFTCPSSISIGESAVGKSNEFIACPNSKIIIGDNTYFNSSVNLNSSIGGSISIGDNCLIGPNFIARTASHAFRDKSRSVRSQGHNCLDIVIHNDVWIAANVTVLGGVILSEGCVVGAGAVVTKSLPPYSVAYGIPARVVSYRL